MPTIACVLFDLDGTLVDTAPDLAGALNRTRQEDGLAPLPLAALRNVCSQGVRGLLRVGYQRQPGDSDYETLTARVLAYYAQHIAKHSQLFDGMPALLQTLETRNIPWGIVTNKHARFTTPLCQALQLDQRAASIISGDTTAHPKPAADPLLLAAQQCGVAPAHCLYLGDDERDIQAAHAAGMQSCAVTWGYSGPEVNVATWGAQHNIDTPAAVLAIIDQSKS